MTINYKKITTIGTILVFSFSLSSVSYAKADPTSPSVIERFKTSITQIIDSIKTKGPVYVCSKGDLFGGKVTLRSFKGGLANIEEIGKAAFLLCNQTNLNAADYKSFLDSSFYKIAFPYLKGKTQKQVTDELVAQLKTRGNQLAPVVKGFCPKLPAFAQTALKSVCAS